ncbi:MAG: nucleoside deaminase [Pseudomonadota bacterium]|nr:nucleoside deaminase [Pseudomonadota bacterium]
MLPTRLTLSLPDWVAPHVSAWPEAAGDEARMRLVLGLAKEHVERDGGGPFAAAVFAGERVIAVGVNRVLPEQNSLLHAEVLAIMLAEKHFASHNLGAALLPRLELVSSCEPCAMCLGAILWSGLKRVVSGASREVAEQAGFDEGPVFPASHRYLEARGIELVHGVLREEAREVFDLYRLRDGRVY